jgi:type I restriction enzyme R subunit
VANQLLVLAGFGWRLKIGARAQVRLAIEDALDEGLPRAYSKELYQTKCTAVFEHAYESYQEQGRAFIAFIW